MQAYGEEKPEIAIRARIWSCGYPAPVARVAAIHIAAGAAASRPVGGWCACPATASRRLRPMAA